MHVGLTVRLWAILLVTAVLGGVMASHGATYTATIAASPVLLHV